MTTAQNMLRGRSNVITLTNNSGGGLVAGDVCVQDTSADEKVTTTTSAASVLKVFVAAETIASGAAGKFYESGYCPLVNVNASVTRGRFLFTHTVAKQAAENATYGAGAFGKILKSGTTPSAIIYSATAQVGGGGSGYILIEHQATSGTAGGTFTSGAWQTRPLTTEVFDTGNHVAIASNQMTLEAGTYRIKISVASYNVGRTQLRLQNITDAATIYSGISSYIGTSAAPAILVGRFTLAAQKVLEVQQRCEQTQSSNGFGVEAGSSFAVDHEVYLSAELIRE